LTENAKPYFGGQHSPCSLSLLAAVSGLPFLWAFNAQSPGIMRISEII
jgi:hypothetical protein